MNESTVCTCVTRRVTLATKPVISHEWVHCLYMCHPSCYSCNKASDKSWMSPLSVHVSLVVLLLYDGWHMYRQWTHSWLITGFVTRVTRRVTHVQTVDSFMTYHWVCNKSNTTGDTCTDSGLHPSCYSCYKPSDKSCISPLYVHVSPVVLLLLQTQW
jgi:hypothetical protein